MTVNRSDFQRSQRSSVDADARLLMFDPSSSNDDTFVVSRDDFLSSAAVGKNPMTYIDNWYHVSGDVSQSALLAGNGIAGFRRMWFPAGFQITKLGVAVTVVGDTSSVIRLGIYDDVKGLPTNLLLDAGTQSGTALGVNPVTAAYTVPASGWYHLLAVPQGTPGTNPTLRVGRPTGEMNRFPTTSFVADGNMFQGFYKTGVTGSLPNPLGGVAADAGANSFCIVVAGVNP